MDKKRIEKFKNMSQDRDMDCTNADEELWLVKVPKYVSSKWEKITSGSEGGRLKITTGADGKPEMTCVLTEGPITGKSKSENLPTEHKFIASSIGKQSLAIFSETLSESHKGSANHSTVPAKLTLDGCVTEKCEMRPIADQKYMMLKKRSIMLAQEPERKAMHLKRAVNTFKPVNTHKHIIEAKQKQKEGKKTRDDEEKVQEILFAAFEEHQYYNIKDLEKITKQPMIQRTSHPRPNEKCGSSNSFVEVESPVGSSDYSGSDLPQSKLKRSSFCGH